MTIYDTAQDEPTKLSELLNVRLPFPRRDMLQHVADVLEALIQGHSTCHRVLATFLPNDTSPEARKKRLERCFRDNQHIDEVFLLALLPLLPPGKLVLALDRTNWMHGSQLLNLLVLVADREFIGHDWFRFLRRRGVKRCLRIKGSARVDGDRLDEVYATLARGQTVAMLGKEAAYGYRSARPGRVFRLPSPLVD